jgi:tRNA-specific 2-thiouridylase
LHCAAKTRYRQADQACCVTADAPDTVRVAFAEAQWAVTPGQSVVFYAGEVCLGGGVIAHTESVDRDA